MCIRLLVNKCCWTSFDNKNPLLHPIVVSLSNKSAMQKVSEYLKEKYGEKVVPNEDFHEIFVKDKNYGITVSFLTDEGGTIINAYCHNKVNPYRKKKYLINFLNPIRELLSQYDR